MTGTCGRVVLLALLLAVSVPGVSAEAGRAPGGRLWVTRYDGPVGLDEADAMAVSPDGSRAFVTGGSRGSKGHNRYYATLAYEV
jgi:hypothetical protein